MQDLSRRHFLQGLGMFTLAASMPLRFAHAATASDKRLLVVILRGAMDGLAAVVPYGDRAYADARGAMALPQNADTLLNLDGYFALHSALAPLLPLYQQKEMLILHATATPYRDRSHFDAQDLLENGTDKAHSLSTGWLNRAVSAMHGSHPAIALGASVPLVLRGDAKVTSWAPSLLPDVDEDFLSRVMHMYQNDPLLMNAVTEAQAMKDSGDSNIKRGAKAHIDIMKKVAGFMSPANGARIAAINMGGWDTHANQGLGSGRLAGNLKILAEGLTAFRLGMGDTWKNTAVLAITEFGRTVKGNGTGGTDHGTAGVAFLFGGSVNGGQVIGDWPNLSRLYEDRDLMPANDLRGLLKGTLAQHLRINETLLSNKIFPNSSNVPAIKNLFLSS